VGQRIVNNDRYELEYVRGDVEYPVPVLANTGTSGDAFGRLRTSSPFTVFDSQHRYQENDKWDTALNGGASKTYVANESSINLTVPTTSGAYVYRETKRVFPYQPGKSLLVMTSFAFATAQANLRQRIGYFSAQNGSYLESDGTTTYFVRRSYVTGSVVNTRIAQADWNGDKLDGTGLSGRTLDLAKTQIFWIDIEWLGVGDVRCGFVVDGRMVIAHTFHGDNVNTTSYMTTAVLPLRQEIENTGTTAASATAKQICATVASEGGYEGFSRRYNLSTGSTAVTLATAGTSYPIMAIRLNSTRLDSVIVPSNVSAAVEQTTNNKLDIVQYQVLLNPTITGGTWSTHFNNNVQYNTTISSFTGGTEIAGGYLTSSSSLDLGSITDFNFQLGRTISGTSDVLLIAAVPTNDAAKLFLDLAWFEIV
jgi:hypothetical protein